jgi:hypothetical protein
MRVGLTTVAALAVIAVYAGTIGNGFRVLRNGCFMPYPGLSAVDSNAHFRWFPPRFVCLYKTKAGRVVERSD